MSSEDDTEVGYKKPPRHTRFQPGRSGNPRGRQKGLRNLASDVKRTLEAPVKLNDRGRQRLVSTQEATLLRLREKALNGDQRAIDRLVQLAEAYNSLIAAEPVSDTTLAADDQAILDAFAATIRMPGSPDDSEPQHG
jgi:Family of unknown function (DUF5681)